MEEYLQFLTVPAIAIAVYVVIEVLLKAFNSNETFKRFIPLIALVLGAIFGVVCFYAFPDMINASTLPVAIVLGGASGLAATGSNQIIKQLTKNKKTEETEKEEDKTE